MQYRSLTSVTWHFENESKRYVSTGTFLASRHKHCRRTIIGLSNGLHNQGYPEPPNQ